MQQYKKPRIFMIWVLLFFCVRTEAQQQVENSMSQYFRNKILWNSAYTGIEGGIKIYALQNRSWLDFEGAPVMTGLSAEFAFSKNSAAGVQVISDVTGLLQRTFGIANYAYRIKFSEERSLRLGVAMAFNGDRLNSKYIESGGVYDPAIAFNIDRRLKFDGNFGAVYKTEKLDIGLSVYRIGANLRGGQEVGNLSIAQAGITWNINLGEEKSNLYPVFMTRIYRNTKPVFDLGGQLQYDFFNLMVLYQNTGNIRLGTGIGKKSWGECNFFYNTNVLMPGTSSQQYEVGLGIFLK